MRPLLIWIPLAVVACGKGASKPSSDDAGVTVARPGADASIALAAVPPGPMHCGDPSPYDDRLFDRLTAESWGRGGGSQGGLALTRHALDFHRNGIYTWMARSDYVERADRIALPRSRLYEQLTSTTWRTERAGADGGILDIDGNRYVDVTGLE